MTDNPILTKILETFREKFDKGDFGTAMLVDTKSLESFIIKAFEAGREDLSSEYGNGSAVVLVGPKDNRQQYFHPDFMTGAIDDARKEGYLSAIQEFQEKIDKMKQKDI